MLKSGYSLKSVFSLVHDNGRYRPVKARFKSALASFSFLDKLMTSNAGVFPHLDRE